MENSHFYWVSITGELRMNKRDRNNADENKGWENQGSRIEKNKDTQVRTIITVIQQLKKSLQSARL